MLDNILQLAIPTSFSRQLSRQQLQNVINSYAIVEQALKDFNRGRLTWSEYLDLLEAHEVNIDSYLNTVDHNLRVIGLN